MDDIARRKVLQQFIVIEETQEELDSRLASILAEHNATCCPVCNHKIGWGDIAWNNKETGAGTGYSTVEIQCTVCQREIAHTDSWYPFIENQEDLLHVLEQDWGKYI